MITYTQLGHLGRLGNQLFQYALLVSVSNKTGEEIVLPTTMHNTIWHGQQNLLSNFNLSCSYSDNIEIKRKFRETHYLVYHPEVYENASGTDYFGFFQNTKYLEDIRHLLLKEFRLKEDIIERAKNILEPLKDKKIVSVHFRRGDLLTENRLPGYLDENGNMSNSTILGTYINSALKRFNENDTVFYVISGGSRAGDNTEDIQWCEENFKPKNVVYSKGVEDIVEFAILTLVDANICSLATTFGWWGSYLNPHQNVIAPAHYDIVDKNINPETYYPKNWHII